eukprot:7104086-Pyramimonas_sp.AAC.1
MLPTRGLEFLLTTAFIDNYPMQLFTEFDGKRLKTKTKTALEYDWSTNMERNMPAQALRYNSMLLYTVAKKIKDVNPTHSITTELTKKASAD